MTQAIQDRIDELGDEAREKFNIQFQAYEAADWMYSRICQEFTISSPEEHDELYDSIFAGLT